MTTNRRESPAITAGYKHAEAFCRMLYRADDGSGEEWIWNSRDGVTPFVIASVSGKAMTHVEWSRDQFVPNYKPKMGERIFVDLTPERARAIAERNAEQYWDDPRYPASAQFDSREALVELLAKSYLEQAGEPDLIAVTRQRRIYVASSWRNPRQPAVVAALRDAGHAVYDFRNPLDGYDNPVGDARGFHWSEIDPKWQAWTSEKYVAALASPIAEQGFQSDWQAMRWADTGVLVLPSGRSAHLEAGYFVGARKDLYILLAPGEEPELMNKMATLVCLELDELLEGLHGRSTVTA